MLSRLSPWWLWAVLSILPAIWIGQAFTSANPRIIHILVHPTGEFAARLLIVTLMITPLTMLFKGTGFARWLRKNRRYFGVAAFGYAALHTLFYLVDKAAVATVIATNPGKRRRCSWLCRWQRRWLWSWRFLPSPLFSRGGARSWKKRVDL